MARVKKTLPGVKAKKSLPKAEVVIAPLETPRILPLRRKRNRLMRKRQDHIARGAGANPRVLRRLKKDIQETQDKIQEALNVIDSSQRGGVAEKSILD